MRRQPKYKCRAKAKEAAIDAGESTAKNKDAGIKRAGKGRALAKRTISVPEIQDYLRTVRKRVTASAD